MNSDYSEAANNLNRIRREKGAAACVQYFDWLAENQKNVAVNAINGGNLAFPSFFVLWHEISLHNMENKLSTRNLAAENISAKALRNIPELQGSKAVQLDGSFHSPKKISYDMLHSAAAEPQKQAFTEEESHAALQWIFITGKATDGLSGEYDQILDTAAAALIRKYHDKAILSDIVKLIFTRNRKGAYSHDLIWAFFQAHDAESLKYIAEYLLSQNKRDVKLAQTLLNLPDNASISGRRNQYRMYLSWLNENRPFIYFTGENFNLTNRPTACSLDISAKYLCKNISPRGKKPLVPLTKSEENCLQCFSGANEKQKKTLADYSCKIHTETPSYWSRWMKYPVEEQIKIAENGLGAAV